MDSSRFKVPRLESVNFFEQLVFTALATTITAAVTATVKLSIATITTVIVVLVIIITTTTIIIII